MASTRATDLAANLAHFASIPWCAQHIHAPGWTAVPTGCREPKASTEDSFFAKTLQTPTTMARHVSLYKEPGSSGEHEKFNILACRSFWELGEDLNGFPQTAHGGLLATLLDEQMGLLLTANAVYSTAGPGNALITAMTVYLNVRFKAPVETPGVVMTVAECTKREGRKTFLRAAVVDANGKECAIGEAMFLDVPATRL